MPQYPRGGYSHWEPEDDTSKFSPRFFRNAYSAHYARVMYLRGTFKPHYEKVDYGFVKVTEISGTIVTAVDRNPADFEIVIFRASEVFRSASYAELKNWTIGHDIQTDTGTGTNPPSGGRDEG